MRVRLEQSGGLAAIPGLQRPVEVDTARLNPDQTATLEGLVQRTGMLEGSLPSVTRPAAGLDLRDYTLTVEESDVVRTVRLRDPLDDAVAALVEHLQTHRHPPTSGAP